MVEVIRATMRINIIAICLLVCTWANAQVKSRAISSAALPKGLRYQGKPAQVMQFDDATGKYLALTSQTGEQPQKGDDEFKQAHLYGYVYQLTGGGSPTVLWQLHDFVTDCNLDMVTGFVPGSLAITDLDKNGKAEVWVVYRLSCRGDVSPSELKIIMHEGTRKYAMRGISKIRIGNSTQHDGGVITSNDMKAGPAIFSQYAGKLWNKYVMETMN